MKMLIGLVVGLSCAATAAQAAPQRLKGSDTLAGVMNDAIIASGLQGDLVYEGGGSGKGESGLLAKTQGLAAMSRKFSAPARAAAAGAGTRVVEHVIGLDGIALFVKESNPVTHLDLAQLKQIYSCQATRWEDVRGSGLTGAIQAYRRNDTSGTTDTFKSLVGITEFGACVKVAAETADIAQVTAAEPLAIGYAGLSAERPGNRALAIARQAGGARVLPNVQSIRSFRYPLARRLYVYQATGSFTTTTVEARLLTNLLDRSFLDPILQDNGFFTVN